MNRHGKVTVMSFSQVMGRTLSSLKADESKLASELQEKQTVLATFSEGMDELKAKQDRAALQVNVNMQTGILILESSLT